MAEADPYASFSSPVTAVAAPTDVPTSYDPAGLSVDQLADLEKQGFQLDTDTGKYIKPLDVEVTGEVNAKPEVPTAVGAGEGNGDGADPYAAFSSPVAAEHSIMDGINMGLTDIRKGLDAPFDLLAGAANGLTNSVLGTDLSAHPFSDQIDAQTKTMGGPVPTTDGEKIVSAGVQNAASGLPLAVAGIVPIAAEAAAGMAGGMAGEGIKQAGGGPVAQIAGTLAGNLVGAGSVAGLTKAAEGIGGLVNSEARIASGERTLSPVAQSFHNLDVPAIPADVGGHFTRMLTAGSSKLTLGGIPIEAAAQRSIAAARAARDRIASGMGIVRDNLGAGQAAQKGARQAIETTGDRANDLYRAIPVASDRKATLASTRAGLADLIQGFTSNPQLSKIWTGHPRLRDTLEALTPTDTRPAGKVRLTMEAERVKGAEAALSRAKEEAQAAVSEAERGYEAIRNQVVAPSKLVEARGKIESARARANELDGSDTSVPEVAALKDAKAKHAEAFVEAHQPPMGGEVSWQDLNRLRTIVGEIVGQPGLAADGNSTAALRKFYGALSQDMRATAKADGPKSLAAFERANTYYRARQDRIDNVLAPLLGKKGDLNGEDAFRQIESWSTNNGDVFKLARALRSLPEDEAESVRASIFSKLGTVSKGRQNADGDVFSPADFMTHWNGLSSRAKSVLFPGAEYRQSIDDLVRIADAQKAAAKLGQGSPTAHLLQSGQIAGRIGGFALSLFSNPLTAMAISADVGGELAVGKLLASPRFARWLASAPSKPNAAAQLAHINRLTTIAASQPAIANDILNLQERLAAAFISPSRPLAADEKHDSGSVQVQKAAPQNGFDGFPHGGTQ